MAGFCDLCREKIDGHRIKTCFRTAHQNGRDKSQIGIGAVGFKNIQHKAGGGRRGKQLDEYERRKLGRKAGGRDDSSGEFSEKIQKAGGA